MRLAAILFIAVISFFPGSAVAQDDSKMTTSELIEEPPKELPVKLTPGPPPKVNPARKLPKMTSSHLLVVKPAEEVPKMNQAQTPEVKAAGKAPKLDPTLPEDPTAKRNKGIMEKMKAANKINPDEYKETDAYKNASPESRKDIDRKVERARSVTGRYDNQQIFKEE